MTWEEGRWDGHGVIEGMLRERRKDAPRITPGHLDDLVSRSAVDYHVFPGTTLTACCLTLPNGFHVLGHSAAASAENFDEEIGRRVALADACRQLRALEGYLLRERLSEASR